LPPPKISTLHSPNLYPSPSIQTEDGKTDVAEEGIILPEPEKAQDIEKPEEVCGDCNAYQKEIERI